MAVASSEDQMVVQLEGRVRNRQTHRLFGPVTKDRRPHPLVVAVMLRIADAGIV